jgi:hypothetical protein
MSCKKQPEPEPVPQVPFANTELATISDITSAIQRIRSSIACRIERNRHEKTLLDRAEIQSQLLLLLLREINTAAVESPLDPAL